MIEVETVARKWGNSIGVSIPKDVVEKIGLKPNKGVKLLIPDRKIDLSQLYGTLKIKRSTQGLLNEIREGEK